MLLLSIVTLAACEPDNSVIVEMQEVSAAVEDARLPYYPYFSEWTVCEINGELYNDVTFMYTDLGLGYMVDDILYYKLDMVVTYCEGVIVQGVNDK